MLQSPQNGEVIIGSTRIGSTADYRCNNGYRLIGYDRRQCLDNGVWSMEPPTCQGSPIIDELIDINIIICLVIVIICSSLEPPVNGGVTLTGAADFGSTAVYYCFTGYRLIGEDKRYCQENGVWSGITPTCQGAHFCILINLLLTVSPLIAIDCGKLQNPLNGDVDYEGGTVYQSVATYSCCKGFEINGDDQTRVCDKNGTWLGTIPSCKRIQIIL